MKQKYILMTIPHNPLWIGSPQPIFYHPAFLRKLLFIADLFPLTVVFLGGNNRDIQILKLNNNVKVLIIQIKYINIVSYSLQILVYFIYLIIYFRLKGIKQFILYSFNHAHLYSLFLRILCKLLGFKIISFYMTKPFNFKEKITYFISKSFDDISLTNHPLLVVELKLKKYIVIPNIPKDLFVEFKPSMLTKIINNIDKKTPSIIFVGRLSPEKDPELVLYIFYKLLKKCGKDYPDLKLFIIGDGPLKNKLRKICKNLNIENHVKFIGHLSLKEVLNFMRISLMLIHTSLHEFFPNVLVEAIAMGTLIAVPNLPQYKWIANLTLINIKDIDCSAENLCTIIKDRRLYDHYLYFQLQRLLYIYMIYQKNIKKLRQIITEFWGKNNL